MFPLQQDSTTNLSHLEVSFPFNTHTAGKKKTIKIWWVEFNEDLYDLHASNSVSWPLVFQIIPSYFATTSMGQSLKRLLSLWLSAVISVKLMRPSSTTGRIKRTRYGSTTRGYSTCCISQSRSSSLLSSISSVLTSSWDYSVQPHGITLSWHPDGI